MKKYYMYKCIVTSPYGERTMFLCTSKTILSNFIKDNYIDCETEVEKQLNKFWKISDIFISNKYYCTDNNIEIHSISLS